ncbi:GD15436 [Drosophila simulans]|uniref:GD15436 n=1 Tax=Drosophila simulans TaxID=7240 RepID=B4NSL0_DROSI|nr:GD15436 [Drosophila simulans]
MVVVQGMYEVTELVAGSVGCVCLYMAGCNALPIEHIPDLPSALFVLSTVLVLHHLRVMNCAPLQKLWILLVELLVSYVCTQVVVLLWLQLHRLMNELRDQAVNTRMGLHLLETYPKVFMFLRQDVCYFGQLIMSLACTYKCDNGHSCPGLRPTNRRTYRYYETTAMDDNLGDGPRRSYRRTTSDHTKERPRVAQK